MEKLTACRDCEYFEWGAHNCFHHPFLAICTVPEIQMDGTVRRYFEPYYGEIVDMETPNPFRINTDGHCPHFKEKESKEA